MATMDDIAKKLGITKGTVSKALSGAEDVSFAMRKSVIETAVELGYSRIPRTSDTPRIAVFIENMDYKKPTDFGWDLVTGFRKMAEPDGYAVDIIPLSTSLEKEMPYDEYMLLNNYKGAFFIGLTFQDPWMMDFKTSRVPTVLFDNQIKYNPCITQVGVDNDEGMDMAISLLRSLGHTTIGYLSGALGSYIFQERYLAFFRALRKHHLNDHHSLAGHAYYTSECLETHLPRLLKAGCTAIICSYDILAHSVILHCQEKGLRIPEDLSIMGVDDIPLSRVTNPPLATIRQDRTELGKGAYYALSSQINQIHINVLKMHPEIIQRESVGTAPQGFRPIL